MASDSELIPTSFAAPGIIEVFGDADTGKTSLALAIGRCFSHTAVIDLEHKATEGDILVVHPSCAEDTIKLLHELTLRLPHGCIILDSLPMLRPALQAYGVPSDPFKLSRMLVAGLREVSLLLYQRQSLLILVNHLREVGPQQWYKPLGQHYQLFCQHHLQTCRMSEGRFIGRVWLKTELSQLHPKLENT